MSRVAEAMRAVDRRDFLPEGQRRHVAVDAPIDIGYGVTNSQPTTVRIMLELLDPQPGDRVLDVGAGSGWTTALLAWLVGESGEVVAVERIPELVTMAREALADVAPATLHQAESGVLGWPPGAPYDRILVSAEASRLPAALVDQLAVGGVLVVPVNGVMLRVVQGDEAPDVTEHGRFRFVPLHDS